VGVRALTVAVVLASVAVVAGCGGDGDDPPAASVPSGSEASADPTTSTTVGVDEVPDEITVEYVQRVMDALDASWGDMYRLYVASGGPTAETAAWLDALYDGEQQRRMDVALGEEAADGFDSTLQPPGDPRTHVLEILSASSRCVRVRADRDYDRVLGGPPTDDKTTDVALRFATPSDYNVTTWQITRELSGAIVEEDDPCA
jgi:hypothetical protein